MAAVPANRTSLPRELRLFYGKETLRRRGWIGEDGSFLISFQISSARARCRMAHRVTDSVVHDGWRLQIRRGPLLVNTCPFFVLWGSRTSRSLLPIVKLGLGAISARGRFWLSGIWVKGRSVVNRIIRASFQLLALSTFLGLIPAASANTLGVGPGKQFATPCAAIAAASPGDLIQIDSSGNYSGDVCQWNTSNLTLIGVGSGRAVINAAGKSSQGKGIWVISGSNTTVENIEFTGATVVDLNGAGIRQEGSNLTVRNCYFHDNQEGILTDGGNSTILIEFSEFSHNGAGDGFSHNLYIGNITKFIFRYNYSHGAVIGHLLKSRAAENDIYYNRFSDESTGTASYNVDLPNGGLSFIIGNLIEKGPQAQNSALVSYQEEGANAGNPDHELFVIGNTMVNDLGHGTFVVVDGSVSVPAVIKDNIFQGTGSVTTQSSAIKANNFSGNASLLNPAAYDYHLQPGSPAIDAGTDPGQGAGVSLAPVFQYVHPACAEGRTTTGSAIDIGAYELNGGNATPPPNAPSRCGAGSSPAPSANLSVNSLTFAAQTLNTTSPSQSVTLTNAGNASLTISSIALAGTNPGDFHQSNNCGASLAAGSSCSIGLTFAPVANGARLATLSVSDNASGSPQSVSLSGTGVSAAPVATLSPLSLTFGSLASGTTSPAQQVQLTNSGNAVLNISSITASGDFAETNNCGATLAFGTNCTISVTFTPTAGGTRTGTLSVTDDAAGSPQKTSLSGTGLAPAPSVSVSPSSLNFAGQLLASTSATQQIKLSNAGNASLSISSIASSGDFSQSNNCGSSLAANANCSINVSFKPSAGGSRTGTLSITDNAAQSPQTVALSGTGQDFSLSVSPSSATVNAGQSVSLTLAISPDGGFNQLVSLTCTGAPKDSACAVTPSSVTPNGSGVSSVSVSITTTARSFLMPPITSLPLDLTVRIVVTVLSCALLLCLAARRPRRMAFGFGALLLIVLASGCAGITNQITPPGSSSGTTAGNYSLTVEGTSGNISHTAVIALKVN
jgi:hypothetical protein